MTFATDDRVYETSITTGTGTYTLDGAATGFTTFAGMGANNDCPYFATDDTNWEVGIGTVLTGPNRLQRTTILRSSNADAAVNWGAGTRKIRCGWPADYALRRNLSKSIAGGAGATTLTTDEANYDRITLTGALTGNRTVEVDATPRVWSVYNNTSGAYTVTMKVTGQTGVAVPQGYRTLLECNGTDVVLSIDWLNNLRLGGTLTADGLVDASGANAGQFKFPVTQNPSADANTLDDYEEGTWTPALDAGGSSPTVGYGASRSGRYIKIGRIVHAWGCLHISSVSGGSGQAKITGLPAVPANDVQADRTGCTIQYAEGFPSTGTPDGGLIVGGESAVGLFQRASADARDNLSNNNDISSWSGNELVYFSVTYRANA